jgi:hypothetical protein
MEDKKYLIIQNNVVVNLVVWNGDVNTWTPPSGSIALIQESTLARVWRPDQTTQQYVLQAILGEGGVDFTWDGTILTTYEPQPEWDVIPTTTIG